MPPRKGQKVRCINGTFAAKERYWCKHLPVYGATYTVRDAIVGKRGLGLRLVEIVNPKIPVINIGEIEPLFLSTRFYVLTEAPLAAVTQGAGA